MAGLRVVVDLSAYFLDHRRKSLIYVDRDNIKSVENLVNHISRIFLLDDQFEVFISEAHVPRSESADIIQEGDVLRIEKVSNLPEESDTSLCGKTSKTSSKKILLDGVIPESKKKKKRKVPAREEIEDKITELTKENGSETWSSGIPFIEEPRKKKKLEVIPQDDGCEAMCEAWEIKPKRGEKRSGKKPSECSQDSLAEEDFNVITNLKDIRDEIDAPIDPGQVRGSTPIADASHLDGTVAENNSVCVLESSIDKSLTFTSVSHEDAGGSQEASDSICESYDFAVGSRPARKRRRQQKRNKSKVQVCQSASTLNTAKVVVDAPIDHGQVRGSTQIADASHLDGTVAENNSVCLQESSIDKSLTFTRVSHEDAGGSQEASDSICESYDYAIGSRPARKRRRQRKRKKSKVQVCQSASTLNTAKVVVLKSLQNGEVMIAPGMNKGSINNKHLRFSDEDEITEVKLGSGSSPKIEVKKNKNVDSVCSDGVYNRNAVEVQELRNEEYCSVKSVKENRGFALHPVRSSLGRKDDLQISQGNSSNFRVNELLISENRCSENGVEKEVVVKGTEVEGTLCGADNIVCTEEVSVEDPPSKPGNRSDIFKPQNKGNRRKNVIIAMGLGATLSHLMKESNVSRKEEGTPCEKEDSCKALKTLTPVVPDVEVKPVKNNKDKRYAGFPVLEKFPRKGDILAFKILKLNENYEPTVTEYLEGKIIDCDNASTLVTVEILGGSEELTKTSGKFDIEEDDEDNIQVSEVKNKQEALQLNWKDFIEPRLVFP